MVAFYVCSGVVGGSMHRIVRVWRVLGASMCRTLCVWKLKSSINRSRLRVFKIEGPGGQTQSYFTCVEGAGGLRISYFTCLEAQNVDKSMTFARFGEAQGGSEHGGPVENEWNLGLVGT